MPSAFASAPSATKAATLALMDALRQELRPTGVDVISIRPVVDVFAPYLGTRGYALAKSLCREMMVKDDLFGLFFDRFLERHHDNTSGSPDEENSFVESGMPLLNETANAMLSSLRSYPAPCSVMVTGWSTRWWDRCLRCRSKENQQKIALRTNMRPIAGDYMDEYGWILWVASSMYQVAWWFVFVMIGSTLLV